MRRNLRPFFTLMVLIMSCIALQAQEPTAVNRPHLRNTKHQAHQRRVQAGSSFEAAILKPYKAQSALIKRGRKGSRPVKVVGSKSKDSHNLYLDFRVSKRSTREVNHR